MEPLPELTFPNDQVIQRADGTVAFFYRTNFVSPPDLVKALTDSGFAKLLVLGTSRSAASAPFASWTDRTPSSSRATPTP